MISIFSKITKIKFTKIELFLGHLSFFEDIENPLSLILCRTAILKNCFFFCFFFCKTIRWFCFSKLLLNIIFCGHLWTSEWGIGEWSKENRRNGGRSAGNQVENAGNRVGNVGNQCGNVGNAGNQGGDLGNMGGNTVIRLEMRGNLCKNKGLWMEMKHTGREKRKNYRKCFCLQLHFMWPFSRIR